MASTTAGAALTEAHGAAQARIAARAVQSLLASWGILDPENLDATVQDWLRITIPLVQQNYAASAALASSYLAQFRGLELGLAAEPYVPALAAVLDQQAVATSLLVTGPVSLKTAMRRGASIDDALDVAKSRSAGAGARHTLAGGRSTIHDSVDADTKALGWARVLRSGKPCAFCAMLASRGPVYKTRSTAEHSADGTKYHDNCYCSAEPVYRADAEWPSGGRGYQKLWNDATGGYSGKDALNAFRRALG